MCKKKWTGLLNESRHCEQDLHDDMNTAGRILNYGWIITFLNKGWNLLRILLVIECHYKHKGPNVLFKCPREWTTLSHCGMTPYLVDGSQCPTIGDIDIRVFRQCLKRPCGTSGQVKSPRFLNGSRATTSRCWLMYLDVGTWYIGKAAQRSYNYFVEREK